MWLRRIATGQGRTPGQIHAICGLVLLVAGSLRAEANPVVVRSGGGMPASAGLAPAEPVLADVPPVSPELPTELAGALPLPNVVAPAVDSAGTDPRIAYLPSDHATRSDRVQRHDPNIHIPEPASIVLVATGAVGLLARRALRRKQN